MAQSPPEPYKIPISGEDSVMWPQDVCSFMDLIVTELNETVSLYDKRIRERYDADHFAARVNVYGGRILAETIRRRREFPETSMFRQALASIVAVDTAAFAGTSSALPTLHELVDMKPKAYVDFMTWHSDEYGAADNVGTENVKQAAKSVVAMMTDCALFAPNSKVRGLELPTVAMRKDMTDLNAVYLDTLDSRTPARYSGPNVPQ